jgi:hypothetical protein
VAHPHQEGSLRPEETHGHAQSVFETQQSKPFLWFLTDNIRIYHPICKPAFVGAVCFFAHYANFLHIYYQ